MSPASAPKRVLLIAGATAIAGMAALAGCSAATKPSDVVTPSPSTGSAAPSAKPTAPTEKAVIPSGGNSFAPPITAKPAPTALPGRNQTGN